MNNNIIFIAGIHGVGKTTLCKIISKKYNIQHYSASTLITNASKQSFDTLFIKNIDENQLLLLNAVHQLLDKNKQYLLDGHFCLLNQHKAVEKIPQKVFELLGIKVVMVLVEDISTIFNRLKNRTGIEYNVDLLCDLQRNELDYSKKIASVLNVPYVVLDISNLGEVSFNQKLSTIFSEILLE